MKRITPFLWFDNNAEEAARFYVGISAGGETSQCGWLKDKFGLSWQVTPTVLAELISDPDPEKSQRLMNAMMEMEKLEIAKLKPAYQG